MLILCAGVLTAIFLSLGPERLKQKQTSTGSERQCLVQGVMLAEDDIGVLTLIDTAGCGMEEAADEDSDSKRNEGEAEVTLAHAQRLVSGGVRPEDIGIITPYNAQVRERE